MERTAWPPRISPSGRRVEGIKNPPPKRGDSGSQLVEDGGCRLAQGCWRRCSHFCSILDMKEPPEGLGAEDRGPEPPEPPLPLPPALPLESPAPPVVAKTTTPIPATASSRPSTRSRTLNLPTGGSCKELAKPGSSVWS